MRPFHYAFKVKDIASTRSFYIDVLECEEGRSTERWIDFNFFGNQLSAHISENIPALDYCGSVDGVSVPIPHFGAVISMADFDRIEKKLAASDIRFIINPQIRYGGLPGEQKTMFVLDHSNNPIEFKAFRDESEMFSK
jgi:uncharacterized protein